MQEGLIKVVAPIDGTPAAKAGTMANDIITHINEEPIQASRLIKLLRRCAGP
jgi:carboxyl-terminal processing protease